MCGFNKLSGIACILFLLPLLYINAKDCHDWGDDFAQYFLQARNIVENRPQTDNGLVFDKVDGDFALHAYPAEFPLIICPFYYFFQLSSFWHLPDGFIISQKKQALQNGSLFFIFSSYYFSTEARAATVLFFRYFLCL